MGNQNSINHVILVGRLARDIELKDAKAGKTRREFAKFTVITNEIYRDLAQNQTITKAEPHTVVAWGGRAKFVGTYGRKGKLISIIGKLRHSKYDDKDGKTVYTTEVQADEVVFLGPKGDPVVPEKPKKEEDESEEYKEKPF